MDEKIIAIIVAVIALFLIIKTNRNKKRDRKLEETLYWQNKHTDMVDRDHFTGSDD